MEDIELTCDQGAVPMSPQDIGWWVSTQSLAGQFHLNKNSFVVKSFKHYCYTLKRCAFKTNHINIIKSPTPILDHQCCCDENKSPGLDDLLGLVLLDQLQQLLPQWPD